MILDSKIYNFLFGNPIAQLFVSSTDAVLLPDDLRITSLFSFQIELSLAQISYERNNYTMLQFMGDVGAIFSTLIMISNIVIFSVFRI